MKQACFSLFFAFWCFAALGFGVEYPMPQQNIGTVTFMQYGHNRLWLVANEKLYMHNGFELKAVKDSFLLNKAVQRVFVSDSGVYIGFLSDGIGFYHPKKRKAYAVFSPKQGYPILPDLRVGAFFKENDTSLWVQTHHQGLTILHKTKPVFYNYPTSNFIALKDRGSAIVSDMVPHQSKPHQYWVATLGGLFLFDAQQGKYVDFFDFKAEKNIGQIPNDSREKALRGIYLTGNTAWLGTWSGGLVALNLETYEFIKYDIPRPQGVSRLINVRQLWPIKPGQLRLSSTVDGVWDFDVNKRTFSLSALPATWPKNANPTRTATCKWGTYYAGVNSLHLQIEEQDWPWQVAINDAQFIKLNAAQPPIALLNNPGTVNLSTGEKLSFKGSLPPSGYGLHNMGNGNFAFVNRREVSLWYQGQWLNLNLYWREKDPFKGGIISSFYDSQNGLLYLGTAGIGARLYEVKTATWRELASPELSRFWIKAYAQRGKSVCIANEQQLHFYTNHQAQKVIELNNLNKLPKGAIISKIYWLKADEIWVLLNRGGLAKINLKTLQVERWIKPNPLTEENFYDAAFTVNAVYLATKNGLLWQSYQGPKKLFGSSYGLGTIRQVAWSKNTLWLNHQGQLLKWENPQPQQLATYLPRPHLYDFKIMGQSASLNSQLNLPHNQNWLEWAAVPSSFVNPGKGDVQLRLEGFTNEWRGLEAGQSYSISNLGPGSYKLLGRCLSAEGELGEPQVLMRISILPAWYKTWWFYLLSFLFIGSLLYSFYRYRLAQLQEKQALENKYLDQLRSLEMRMLRVQMNPHFIFNALNSVRYYILKQDRKKASDYLTRFSKLLRFILNLSKLEQVSLAEELQGIDHYIKFEQIRFNQGFHFQLELKLDRPAEEIAIQPMLIQPFLENAIWHGLMPLEQKGTLKLSIEAAKQSLYIVIDDNGVGRATADLNNRKAQKSYGLSITKERLEALNKNTGQVAHFEIIDKKENGQAAGTRIQMELPYKVLRFSAD